MWKILDNHHNFFKQLNLTNYRRVSQTIPKPTIAANKPAERKDDEEIGKIAAIILFIASGNRA